jgi:hypothetical protein
MSLDIPTLFVIAVFVCAVAGSLLLLSWLQNRNVRAPAFWAPGLIIGSIGVALIAARGNISDAWSIAIANAILATAYGMMWPACAITMDTRRPPRLSSSGLRFGSSPVTSRYFSARHRLAPR